MKTHYNKTNWVDNKTPINAENLNNIERGIENIYSNALSLSELIAGSGIKISYPTSDDSDVQISLNLRKVSKAPASSEDSGELGDYYIDLTDGYLYFCINAGTVGTPIVIPKDIDDENSEDNGDNNNDRAFSTINWIKIKLDLRF